MITLENQHATDRATEGNPEGPGGGLRRAFAGVPVGRIFFYFLTSRLLILLMSRLSLPVVKKGDFFPGGKRKMIDWLNCWDAGWYLKIAKRGYEYDPAQGSSVAFFPLYPWMMRIAGYVVHDLRVAGLLISNLFLFLSALLLWKLARQNDARGEVADWSVIFFLFGPLSFFYSSIYTESVCIFWMMAALYLAGERRWLAAGLCGYFAALSRSVGVLLAAPLAIEFLVSLGRANSGGVAGPRRWLSGLACIAMPGLGLATYCLFLWWKFGEPFAFLKTQAYWGHHFTWFWITFQNTPAVPFYRFWFFASVYLAVGLILLGMLQRIRLSFLVFEWVYLALVLSSAIMEGIPRYLSIVFPFYISLALASVRWPRLQAPLLAFSAALLALSTILFVNGYWFT